MGRGQYVLIGYTIGNHCDDADQVGDDWLLARLLRLGDPQLPAPLLEISGDRANMRDVQVALTPFGLDVLEGKALNYPTNPIDDWAAGVRLSSADGVLWFSEGWQVDARDTPFGVTYPGVRRVVSCRHSHVL